MIRGHHEVLEPAQQELREEEEEQEEEDAEEQVVWIYSLERRTLVFNLFILIHLKMFVIYSTCFPRGRKNQI